MLLCLRIFGNMNSRMVEWACRQIRFEGRLTLHPLTPVRATQRADAVQSLFMAGPDGTRPGRVVRSGIIRFRPAVHPLPSSFENDIPLTRGPFPVRSDIEDYRNAFRVR